MAVNRKIWLDQDEILKLQAHALDSRADRDNLLGGVSNTIVSSLPKKENPSAQLLSDLNELNTYTEAKPDQKTPLEWWLTVAKRRANQGGSESAEKYFDEKIKKIEEIRIEASKTTELIRQEDCQKRGTEKTGFISRIAGILNFPVHYRMLVLLWIPIFTVVSCAMSGCVFLFYGLALDSVFPGRQDALVVRNTVFFSWLIVLIPVQYTLWKTNQETGFRKTIRFSIHLAHVLVFLVLWFLYGLSFEQDGLKLFDFLEFFFRLFFRE